MKVLFDDQIFSMQKYGGVSKYFCEILKKIPREYWDISLWFSDNEYLKYLPNFHYIKLLPNLNFRGKSKLMGLINRPYSIAKLSRDNYDIFHQTHFGLEMLKYVKNKKVVITFHDMNHTKFSNLYNFDTKKVELMQKQSIQRADKIVTVSHTTKKDLVEIWNINPQKITVIYHGIDLNNLNIPENKRIIDNPYILYVGERGSYKNFNRFISAFSNISYKYSSLKLVCTGKQFTNDEIIKFQTLKIEDKVIYISANEIIMKQLYNEAEMFVYPSLSEGFGMPVLEAMAQNCVVVLSNVSCFPEIADKAGVYFNPYSIDDIIDKIELVLNSFDIRQEKIKMGQKNVSRFSWEKTANQHFELYKSLI
jgi:glycosyltransferase involved in cell wall biosynthesis